MIGNEWITYVDPNTNCEYYYNSKTGETQWEPPSASMDHDLTTPSQKKMNYVRFV